MPYDSLAIDISDACNLRCRYCFERLAPEGSGHVLDDDKLFAGIACFFERLAAPKRGTLHFHFGRREPLLGFSRLQRVVERIEQHCRAVGAKARYHLTSNGTLLGPDAAAFFKEHDFDLRISLDGGREVHDLNRPLADGGGSHHKARRALALLREHGLAVTVNTVYAPDTPLPSVLRHCREAGATRVDLFPLWLPDTMAAGRFDQRHRERFAEEMDEIAQDIMASTSDNDPWPRLVNMERMLRCHCGFGEGVFYCGAGRNYLGLAGNGVFYPCLKCINRPGLELGTEDQPLTPNLVEGFRSRHAPPVREFPACRDCDLAAYCKGLCYVDRLDWTQCTDSASFYCQFQRAVFNASQKIHSSLLETRPEHLAALAGLSVDAELWDGE